MSGSIKWFVYTTDAGTDFAIKLDESNTEFINAGTQDFPNGGILINAIPKNIKPRYLRFRSPDGATTRKCVALTPTIFAGVTAATTLPNPNGGADLVLVAKKGEVLSIPFGPDTGLTDGDAT
jgi:hypothetical protein